MRTRHSDAGAEGNALHLAEVVVGVLHISRRGLNDNWCRRGLNDSLCTQSYQPQAHTTHPSYKDFLGWPWKADSSSASHLVQHHLAHLNERELVLRPHLQVIPMGWASCRDWLAGECTPLGGMHMGAPQPPG